MVRKLLELGANANIRDHEGKRPLDMLREIGRRSPEQIKN
jgi:hypothetical protein